MGASFKHYLNPTFAVVFAVGVERFYRLLDPLKEHEGPTVDLLSPSFHVPLAMTTVTLIVGLLAAVANDRLIDANPGTSPSSRAAWLTYASILCILFMFYFAVDVTFIPQWVLAYGVLCLVNAVWNCETVTASPPWRHVVPNFLLGTALVGMVFLVSPGSLRTPSAFYVLLAVIGGLKWWQRKGDLRFTPPQPGGA